MSRAKKKYEQLDKRLQSLIKYEKLNWHDMHILQKKIKHLKHAKDKQDITQFHKEETKNRQLLASLIKLHKKMHREAIEAYDIINASNLEMPEANTFLKETIETTDLFLADAHKIQDAEEQDTHVKIANDLNDYNEILKMVREKNKKAKFEFIKHKKDLQKIEKEMHRQENQVSIDPEFKIANSKLTILDASFYIYLSIRLKETGKNLKLAGVMADRTFISTPAVQRELEHNKDKAPRKFVGYINTTWKVHIIPEGKTALDNQIIHDWATTRKAKLEMLEKGEKNATKAFQKTGDFQIAQFFYNRPDQVQVLAFDVDLKNLCNCRENAHYTSAKDIHLLG